MATNLFNSDNFCQKPIDKSAEIRYNLNIDKKKIPRIDIRQSAA